jgi:hypothetical protein
VQAAQLQALTALPKLTHLYLWNTPVQKEEIAQLQQSKNLVVETGFKGDTMVIKLNPPIIENDVAVLRGPMPLKLKHYINGAIIRYTLDGTEPDSLTSPLYSGPVTLDSTITVKAKAYKPNWISSDVAIKTFYKSGLKPDSVALLQLPDPLYKSEGAVTLINAEKGELYNRNTGWLGYRERPLEALIYFSKPHAISSFTISSLVDADAYIMPPQEVEVWGGASAASLRLLQRMRPRQPIKDEPNYIEDCMVRFPKVEAAVLKVVVKPVSKLPAWHPGKGDKAWIFVDEVFIN